MGEMNKKKDLTVVIAIVCAAVLAAVVFGIAAHGISSRRRNTDTSIGGSTQQPDPDGENHRFGISPRCFPTASP